MQYKGIMVFGIIHVHSNNLGSIFQKNLSVFLQYRGCRIRLKTCHIDGILTLIQRNQDAFV